MNLNTYLAGVGMIANHDLSLMIANLGNLASEDDFAGYDPYDALNSDFVRALSFGRKYGRIAWTQFLRRSPINLRPFIGVAKGHNPKALGLFLGGFVKLQAINKTVDYSKEIERLLHLLEVNRSKNCSGYGWGYNFDWQSRAFFIPKFTPTIVNSSFIGHALLDLYELTGNQKAFDMALPIKDFLLQDLNQTQDGDSFCFSYTPVDKTAVHNANLLGASLLIRLFHLVGDQNLRDTALRSLDYSMKYQHAEGSWFYAETSMQSWIDSYHTGFNLQAIRTFLDLGEAQNYRQAYQKGIKFYAGNFFLDDGTPKYYHDRTYPIDIHSPAEAISFFSREGEQYFELTDRVAQWTINKMLSPRGDFYFRKGRKFTNKISYMRWSQAWMFHALTEYQFYRGSNH